MAWDTPSKLIRSAFAPARFRSELADAATFLRQRVRLYIKTLLVASALLAAGGWVGLALFVEHVPEVGWETFSLPMSVFSILPLVFAGGWALLRGQSMSITRVATVEAICSISATTAASSTSAFAVHPLTLVDVLLVVTLILVTRASFVPSSPTRTLVIGLISTLTLTAFAAHWTQQQPQLDALERQLATACGVWGLIFAVVTALLSHVLYGLHEKVRQALQLGNYTLEEKLGQGGMAEVYRARHAWLRRPTVIKLLSAESLGEATVARFEREAQDTAALSHPNIVEIYDFGRTPDGVFYYVMEYIDGVNVDELVERFGPLSGGRAIYLLAQVAHALGHAHAAGLIHRDVKPSNVLVSNRGGVGDVATLVDFGLVKELDTKDDLQLSRQDSLLGTPLYMAPESILGSEVVGPAVDLYALGAVGFFMLTGSNVFEGENIVEVCGKHLYQEPVAPSVRLGRRACSDDLEEVLLRCLKKKPQERYGDAQALRDALLACPEAGQWTLEDASAWWHAHQTDVDEFRSDKSG